LILALAFNGPLAGYVYSEAEAGIEPAAEEEEGLPAAEPAADDAPSDQAQAEEEETVAVKDDNQADVDNQVETTADTGNNQIIPDEETDEPADDEEVSGEEDLPSDEESSEETGEEDLGGEEGGPTTEEGEAVEPTPAPDSEDEDLSQDEAPVEEESVPDEDPGETEAAEPTPTPDPEDESEPASSPGDEDRESQASDEDVAEITNENEAEVENDVVDLAETGGNQTSGDLETGDASASADLFNLINMNLVGSDFWQAVISLYEDSKGDIDLTSLEAVDYLDPETVSVIARNQGTDPETVNLAVANFLSLLAVYNQNRATLVNNVDVVGSTGGNSVDGCCGDLETGNASASANLFNLVNTNLVGQDWFFGILNLFGQLDGDIILPYEFDFLGEDGSSNDSLLAANVNPGSGSENDAQASLASIIEVNNTNFADLDNNISVLANTGGNNINGSGEIKTGEAAALVNLLNFVNTNITGSRWMLLIINDFSGRWQGDLVNWWGPTFNFGRTIFAWVQLPSTERILDAEVLAVNQDTGEDSENQAQAEAVETVAVDNDNQAAVENNVNVAADSGNNQAEGEGVSIKTGSARAVANVLNFINTNIFGNHWYFGLINIFDGFLGNIIFPRPDLRIVKTADKEVVSPGEEIIYLISYENAGRLWAKNVVITDTLPDGVEFVSASGGGVYQAGRVVWNLGRVCSGDEGSFQVVVRVNDDLADGTALRNTAVITTDTCEPCQDNNLSSATVLVSLPGQEPEPTPGPEEPTPSPSPEPTPTEEAGDGAGGEEGEGGGAGVQEGGVGGLPGAPVCSDQPPGGAPRLISAVPGPNSVTLTWEKAPDPVTYYLVAYGVESGSYIYGNPNVGGRETTSYTVGNLSGGTRYYFVVRAGNGCAPGPFSNEVSAVPWGPAVEGAASGFYPGVLGEKKEGEIGQAWTGEEEGEVAGEEAAAAPVCPWWLVLSLLEAAILFVYYWLIGGRRPRLWWLMPFILALLAYAGDHYLAHRRYTPSKYCSWMWLWSVLAAVIPTGIHLKMFTGRRE